MQVRMASTSQSTASMTQDLGGQEFGHDFSYDEFSISTSAHSHYSGGAIGGAAREQKTTSLDKDAGSGRRRSAIPSSQRAGLENELFTLERKTEKLLRAVRLDVTLLRSQDEGMRVMVVKMEKELKKLEERNERRRRGTEREEKTETAKDLGDGDISGTGGGDHDAEQAQNDKNEAQRRGKDIVSEESELTSFEPSMDRRGIFSGRNRTVAEGTPRQASMTGASSFASIVSFFAGGRDAPESELSRRGSLCSDTSSRRSSIGTNTSSTGKPSAAVSDEELDSRLAELRLKFRGQNSATDALLQRTSHQHRNLIDLRRKRSSLARREASDSRRTAVSLDELRRSIVDAQTEERRKERCVDEAEREVKEATENEGLWKEDLECIGMEISMIEPQMVKLRREVERRRRTLPPPMEVLGPTTSREEEEDKDDEDTAQKTTTTTTSSKYYYGFGARSLRRHSKVEIVISHEEPKKTEEPIAQTPTTTGALTDYQQQSLKCVPVMVP